MKTVESLTEFPLVSIIILCRNEEPFIGTCLDSIIENGYPLGRLEIIVADGMSEDKTREVVLGYASRYSVIRLLDNPKLFASAGVNAGIAAATGSIIFILGGHAYYQPGYIECCLHAIEEFDADCVGGVLMTKARDQGVFASAIVLTLSLPLGVGNSRFRTGVKAPQWVDAVAFGCFRRSLFERVGAHNESLVHSHDMDFWNRVRNSGGRILVHPEARAVYVARSSLKEFVEHNFRNGFWVTWAIRLAGTNPSWRHVTPMVSLIGLAIFVLGGLVWQPIWWLGVTVVSAYLLATVTVSLQAAVRRRDWRLLFTGPIAFGTLHVSYGLGSLWGLIKPINSRKEARKRERSSS